MQNLSEIREILSSAGVRPRRRLGQNFLIDKNLMQKLLDLASPYPHATILEVGAGTGSLTEELLKMAGKVVAVEMDQLLCLQLEQSLADCEKLTLICGDALSGKHAICDKVISACGPKTAMVANLPYSIATPLLALCLEQSWQVAVRNESQACLFESMTFTVQEEVAQRLVANPGSRNYGQISVIVSLMGRTTLGPSVPASAFWPRPAVSSRMMRIDFDSLAAKGVCELDSLKCLLTTTFGQRRKQIGTVLRKRYGSLAKDALACAKIAPTLRAEEVAPEKFVALADSLPSPQGPKRSIPR